MFWKWMLVTFAGLALLAGACGGDSDDGDDDADNDGVSTSAPAPTEDEPSDGDDEEPTESADGSDDGDDDSGGGETASMPADACTLVTAEEVATLVPNSQPGVSTSDTGELEARLCLWSSDSEASGTSINVVGYPAEVPADAIIESLEEGLADAGSDGKEVEDVGEFAFFVSRRPNSGELIAFIKGLEVSLNYDGSLGTGEAELIAIAKAVEERL